MAVRLVRLTRYLLFALLIGQATPSRAAEKITSVTLTTDGASIILKFAGNSAEFKAPPGTLWQHLLTSGDGKKAFAVLERGDASSYAFGDVHVIELAEYLAHPTTYQPRKVPLQFGLPEAVVLDVHSASADGARLLITVNYGLPRGVLTQPIRQNEPAYSSRSVPCIFDTATGQATPVAP